MDLEMAVGLISLAFAVGGALGIKLSRQSRVGTGVGLIAADRINQLKSGYGAEHDDGNTLGELGDAAIAYIYSARGDIGNAEVAWPWSDGPIKPKLSIEDLARAGGFIAAEIDRLRRLEKRRTIDG